MIYILLASCIVGIIFTYPVFYNVFIFPKEMEKFKNYLSKEQADLALSVLNNFPEKKKMTLEVQIAFADAHLMKKHSYLSLFHLNEVIEKKLYTRKTNSPNSKVNIHLRKAVIYEGIGKVKNAISEYFHILKVAPKHLVATTEIGKRYFEMKNYTAAVTYLEESYSQNKTNPIVAELLSNIYMISEDYSKSLSFIQQAIRHSNPVHCRLRHKEVLALFHLHRYPEAIGVGDSIEKTYSKTNEIETVMGIAYYHQKEFKKAEALFTKNLSKYSNNYSSSSLEARYLFAEILLSQKNFISALMQLNFIQKGHQAYKDTDMRVEMYQRIVQDKVLNKFFTTNEAALPNALAGFFADERFMLHTSFEKFFSDPNLYIARAEVLATHEKIFICVNISHIPLHNEPFQQLMILQKRELESTKTSIKRLLYFSLPPTEDIILSKLNDTFSSVIIVEKEKFLETIKNKKVFVAET